MRDALRWVGKALGWVTVAIVCLIVSVVYHLTLEHTRKVARPLIETGVSAAIRGSLEIGRLDEIGWSRIVATDVVLRDAEGRAVIRAERVMIWPDLDAFWNDGIIRAHAGRIEHGEVQLYVWGEDGNEVSLVDAFQSSTPSTGTGPASPILVSIEGIVLDDIDVRGDVPGLAGIAADGLQATGSIVVGESVIITLHDATGQMTGPYAGTTEIEDADVVLDTDWTRGLDAFARVRRGDDHVRAHITLTRPDPEDQEAPPIMVLDVRAEPLHIETLTEMGIPLTESLAGEVTGDLRLSGPVDDLALEAYLIHPSGPIRITGRIPRSHDGEPAPMVIEAETYDFDLSGLVPRSPAISFGGTVRVEIVEDPADPRRYRLALRALPLDVAGVAVPAFEADGAIEGDAIVIDRIAAPHLGGEIEGHGRIGFDGSLSVHASIDVEDLGGDPNVARFARGAHGSVRGTVDVEAGPGGSDLAFTGHLVLGNFRYGPLRARRLDVHGRAHGDLAHPIAHFDAHGVGVSISGTELGEADARIDGGPTQYAIRWRSHGRVVPVLEIDGVARRGAETWILEAPSILLDVGTGPMRGSMRRIRVLRDEVRIGELLLEGSGQRIAADARIRFGAGRSHARVDVEGIDLARVAPLVGSRFSTMQGRADAHLVLDGPLDDPDATLTGTIVDLSIDRVRNANIRYDLRYAEGVLTTRVHGDLGSRGQLDIEGPIAVPFAALTNPSRFAEEAEFGLHVYGNHLNLAFITPLLSESIQAIGITGRIGGDLRVDGPLEALRVEPAIIVVDSFALPGWTELRGKLQVTLAGGRLSIQRVWVADASGELALVEGELPLSLDDPPADFPAFLRSLHDQPWRLAVRIEPRRLDGWPRPIGDRLPEGVLASLSVTAAGGDGAPARVDLAGTMQWVDAAVDAPCARGLRPIVQVAGWTRDGETRLDAMGFAGGHAGALVRAQLATPIDEWIRTGAVQAPEPDLVVQLADLPLELIPWTCDRASGLLSADITLEDVLSGAPHVEGQGQIRELRMAGPDDPILGATQPYRVDLAIRGGGEGETYIAGCAIVASEGAGGTPFAECGTSQLPMEGEAIVRGSVPIQWHAGSPLPELRADRDMDLTMLMADAHLEPLLALVPHIAEADVIADGRVFAQGSWAELELTGGIALRDGRVRIVTLGQHLTDLQGALELHGNRIVIPDRSALRARDGEGLVEVAGEVGFHGLVPTHAYLRVAPEEFPVRREGAVLATITGVGDTRMSIETDGLEGTVTTSRLTVRLPEQAAGSVQSLDPHRDLLIIGADSPELAATAGPGYPIHLSVDATEPFWVRRNDFAVQVRAALEVRYLDPNLSVGGTADLMRGYFEVFGKRFEVQRGSLTFDPNAEELNPIVDLVATYELPGRAGATVTVTAGGRLLDDLQIAFSSTETSDQGEIIALLVSGRAAIGTGDVSTSQQQASEQAASFLAGLSAGILTLGLRQQFGDIVPLIAIETGATLGDTRIRAGFNADVLIPDFLREAVLSAYVEGFVTTTGQQQGGGSGGVGGGVTLELQLPYDLVLSGTYVPPTSAGGDLVWEP